MNRVCLTKDGKLIEMQSGGWYHPDVEKLPEEERNNFLKNYQNECLETLKQNAFNAGHAEEDIEVKWVTDAELVAIQEANKPVPTYADLRRAAYPSQYDYLDGIIKGDQDQVKKYILDCLAVKAKYPKE